MTQKQVGAWLTVSSIGIVGNSTNLMFFGFQIATFLGLILASGTACLWIYKLINASEEKGETEIAEREWSRYIPGQWRQVESKKERE